jgi:DNA-binding protein YbaB
MGRKVSLDPEKIDLDDIHETERWIENALRDGYAKAQEIATDKMKPLMGSLGNLGL